MGMNTKENAFILTKPATKDSRRSSPSGMTVTKRFDCANICMDCFSLSNLGFGCSDDVELYSILDEDRTEISTFASSSSEERTLSSAEHSKSLESSLEPSIPNIPGIELLRPIYPKVSLIEDDDYSREMRLLAEHKVLERSMSIHDSILVEEESSRTLNTMSTIKSTQSLDNKTWRSPLIGLDLMRTDNDTPPSDERKSRMSFPDTTRPVSQYDIERVPSLIDINLSMKDDSSTVSSIPRETEEFSVRKNAFENCKYHQRGPSLPSTGEKVPKHVNIQSKFTSPPILHTKSIDVTATTICTDEEYFEEHVPFDEPQILPRLMSIKEIKIGS